MFLGADLTTVSLSLGSNIERYRHINRGLNALEAAFGTLQCSPVYESEAVGFDGNAFLNMIAAVETEHSLSDVIQILKGIEDQNGRDRQGPKFSPRTLDIDVVTYGDAAGELEGLEMPRPELFKNAFVALPLADIWPDRMVPGRTLTFADLWQQEGNHRQKLRAVEFRRDRTL